MQSTKTNRILLIFDNQKERDFITSNLLESHFIVFSSSNLQEGLRKATEINPELIVVDTEDNDSVIKSFNEELRSKINGKTLVLSVLQEGEKSIELAHDLEIENKIRKIGHNQYYITKPIRGKILLSIIRNIMNEEDVKWFPALH